MSLGSKERGCGTRAKGGIYLECGTGGGIGLPMWSLIQDPVLPVDPDELGLQSLGVKFFEMEGVWHILDMIGEKHYPNSADFLEEMVRLGLSRRIARTEDFSLLTPESRIFLVHPKAYDPNLQDMRTVPPMSGGTLWPCPTGKHDPAEQSECAGLQWVTLRKGDTEGVPRGGLLGDKAEEYPEWAPRPIPAGEGAGRRERPSFTYIGRERKGDFTLTPGIIAVCPLERIAVVNDDNDAAATADSMNKAGESRLPVKLEEE